jgi:AcrR family transcriptional regulator
MKRKPKLDVKQKIITTAETLFAQQGFDATSIDQIAKTAGITKSLIYYYFAGKDELLAAIFQNFINRLLEMKNNLHNQLDPAAQTPGLEELLKNYILPFLMQHKDVIKIAFAESLKDTTAIPHLNIFKYFDQNSQIDLDLTRKLTDKFDKQVSSLGRFFFSWAPLFSFVIFSDEWCENYHCDLATAVDHFIKAYVLIYNSISESTPITY